MADSALNNATEVIRAYEEKRLDENYRSGALKFEGLTVLQFSKDLKQLFKAHEVEAVLDYGCGEAKCWNNKKFRDFMNLREVHLYDPYIEAYKDLPTRKFDAVIAMDVMEHVLEWKVDDVIKAIISLADKLVVVSFCQKPATKEWPDGSNPHVTLKPRHWWETRIRQSNPDGLPVYLWENK